MTKKRRKTADEAVAPKNLEKRRKTVESIASIGMLMVAVSLAVPFSDLTSATLLETFKWVFAAGALVYTIARVVNVCDPRDSFRLRRLRRMEAWAGVAFCIASFFWFYNTHRYGAAFGASLTLLRETILFTMVGAILQVVASWMIYAREKKEYGKQ